MKTKTRNGKKRMAMRIVLGRGVFVLIAAAVVILALAPAPAYGAMVVYTGCGGGATYCTLTQLMAGGSISVDADGDGTIDMVFDTWQKTGGWTPPTGLRITGFGGGPYAGIQFTTTNGWTTPAGFTNQFYYHVESPNPDYLIAANTFEITHSTASGTSVVSVSINSHILMNPGGPFSYTDYISPPVSEYECNVSVSGNTYYFPPNPQGSANLRGFRQTLLLDTVYLDIKNALGTGGTLGLGYTDTEINLLYDQYRQGTLNGTADAVTTSDGKTWNYFATDPAWVLAGHPDIAVGESYTDGLGHHYVKLGSGEGNWDGNGGGVPEPSSMIAGGLAGLALLRKKIRKLFKRS